MKQTLFYLTSAVLAWSLMAAPAYADLAAVVSGGGTAETVQLAAMPTDLAGTLDVSFNSIILPVPNSSLVAKVTESVSPMAPAPASGTVLSSADVPVQNGTISIASLSPLSLASQAGVTKSTQGFFLDNPDDSSSGIALSFTTSAPLPIIVMDENPVPLPPAFLLFGSGLVCLAATKLRYCLT